MHRARSHHLGRRSGSNITVGTTNPRVLYGAGGTSSWTSQGNGAWTFCRDDCQVTMSFNGTSIAYSSFNEQRAPRLQAVIDDGPPSEFDPSVGAPTDGSSILNTVFLKTGLSDSKTHTIVVSYVGVGSQGGEFMVFAGYSYIEDNGSGTLNAASSTGSTIGGSGPGGGSNSNPPSPVNPNPQPGAIEPASSGTASTPSSSQLHPLNATSSFPTATGAISTPPPGMSIEIISASGNTIYTTLVPAGVSDATSTEHSGSKAAIIGGAVGGVIGLLIIALICWACYKFGRFTERPLPPDPNLFPYMDNRTNTNTPVTPRDRRNIISHNPTQSGMGLDTKPGYPPSPHSPTATLFDGNDPPPEYPNYGYRRQS